MLLSLHLPSPSPSSSSSSSSSSYHTSSRTFHNQPHYIKFHTSYRQNLRYLQHLSVIPPDALPDSDTIHRIFTTINLLKSHSLSDSDIPRIAAAAPSLFSPSSAAFSPDNISAVFHFLAADVSASSSESRGLVLRCPHLLLSPHPDLCLRPTLHFLRDEIGLTGLNRPTNRNAHLLNTRVEDLRVRVEFLREEVGFEYEEAVRALGRLPAIFGYGLGSNLRPKFEYLVGEMGRDVEELKKFPQYFGFSLHNRIVPRHLHLKQRGVFDVPLNKMLMWRDDRFYSKWK